MSNKFAAFMADCSTNFEESEVIVSKRFSSGGKPVPFKIHPITQDENEGIVKECTRAYFDPNTHQRVQQLDDSLYSATLIAHCVSFPDLNDAELQDSYKAVGAADLARKMLLPGEFKNLANAITSACGFNAGEDLENAKN